MSFSQDVLTQLMCSSATQFFMSRQLVPVILSFTALFCVGEEVASPRTELSQLWSPVINHLTSQLVDPIHLARCWKYRDLDLGFMNLATIRTCICCCVARICLVPVASIIGAFFYSVRPLCAEHDREPAGLCGDFILCMLGPCSRDCVRDACQAVPSTVQHKCFQRSNFSQSLWEAILLHT